MNRNFIPLLAFSALLLLFIPLSFDFARSVVPGWHTTVYPPYFIGFLALTVVLLLCVIGYWLLLKKSHKTNWWLFGIHFTLTLSSMVFLKLPTIFLDLQHGDLATIESNWQFRLQLIKYAWTAFVLAQLLFVVYFLRVVKKKAA